MLLTMLRQVLLNNLKYASELSENLSEIMSLKNTLVTTNYLVTTGYNRLELLITH